MLPDPAVSIGAITAALNTSFETARLYVLPQMSTDAELAFALLQDDRIYQWISMNKPTSVESLRAHWKRAEARVSPNGNETWLAWFISTKADGRPSGSIDACIDHQLMGGKRTVTNFGYYFFAETWGQGYASEAVKVMADTLIAQGVQKIIATVTAGNAASVRVLQKADFRFTRIIPDNDTLNGVLVDDQEYVRT